MLLPISSVDISGNTIFTGNLVGDGGGGVCAVTNSTVDIRGNTTFIGNSATINGSGGIDLCRVQQQFVHQWDHHLVTQL